MGSEFWQPRMAMCFPSLELNASCPLRRVDLWTSRTIGRLSRSESISSKKRVFHVGRMQEESEVEEVFSCISEGSIPGGMDIGQLPIKVLEAAATVQMRNVTRVR